MSWQVEGFGLDGPCYICGGSNMDELLERFIPRQGRVITVIEERVAALHGDKIPAHCYCRLLLPSLGEGLKQLYWFNKILNFFCSAGVRRGDWIMAVGGGALLDLTGFAASTYLRGMRTILVPTTLLAQVDASIGGKCGLNWGGFKNPVGSFHFPKRVLCPQDVLYTLPLRQYYAGMAEVLKYQLLWLTPGWQGFRLFSRAELVEVVEKCCRYKDQLVASDPFDRGLRRTLNFGHTLGHALEALDGTILHGEAVAWGLEFALGIAAGRGYIGKGHLNRVVSVLASMPRRRLPALEFDQVYQKIVKDKKNSPGQVRLILPRGGKYQLTACSRKELEAQWNALLQ